MPRAVPMLYLKKRYLSHRLWPDYDAIADAVCKGLAAGHQRYR